MSPGPKEDEAGQVGDTKVSGNAQLPADSQTITNDVIHMVESSAGDCCLSVSEDGTRSQSEEWLSSKSTSDSNKDSGISSDRGIDISESSESHDIPDNNQTVDDGSSCKAVMVLDGGDEKNKQRDKTFGETAEEKTNGKPDSSSNELVQNVENTLLASPSSHQTNTPKNKHGSEEKAKASEKGVDMEEKVEDSETVKSQMLVTHSTQNEENSKLEIDLDESLASSGGGQKGLFTSNNSTLKDMSE